MAYTEDLIYVFLCDDHTYDCTVDVIGRAGESKVTQIAVQLPTNLNGSAVYLEFETPSGEKFRTKRLEDKAVGDMQVSVYSVEPYLIAEAGEIKVQAIVEMSDGKTWKSYVKKYANLESINATEIVPVKREVVSIDLSKYDSNGEIVEILSDGSEEKTVITFDESGNPTKITDKYGKETTIIW